MSERLGLPPITFVRKNQKESHSVVGILYTLAAFFFLIACHPFITYPLSLRVLRAIRPRPLRPDPAAVGAASPTFAVCVCAYNEAPVIERTIRNLLAMRDALGGNLQILLYVDGATDGTAEIALRYSDQIDFIISPENRGKNHGLNRLADRVRAELVVLIDANVEMPVESFANLKTYFADPTVGCVCGHLTFINADETVTAMTGSSYWRLEERIKQLESDTGSVMGADGSLYAIRRECFQAIPSGAADDMYLSLGVLCSGYRVVRGDDVCAFERTAADPREEFRRKVRIGCQGFSAHLALWSRLRILNALDLYKYLSHKFLRWFTFFSLGASAAFAFAALAVAAGLPIAVVIAVGAAGSLWLGWRMGLKPFTVIVDILRSFAATAIGVWRALNGTLVGTWEPAGSVRKTEEIG
jgi:cellulose synthase/poly-beta-1,6-N-acetylglucosamine synthase-like glycosyltransferase